MAVSRPAVDLSSSLIDPGALAEPPPIVWRELFNNDQPVELEIGSGKGLFLINAAASNLGHNFLGVELARKYARLAAERLVRRELSNAKIWRGDARLVMGRLVPEASLRAVHVYFPDPWWKARHKKRPGVHRRTGAHPSTALEPGGAIRVASDVEEYFTVIQGLIAANSRFSEGSVHGDESPELPVEYLTNFRAKVLHRRSTNIPRLPLCSTIVVYRVSGARDGRSQPFFGAGLDRLVSAPRVAARGNSRTLIFELVQNLAGLSGILACDAGAAETIGRQTDRSCDRFHGQISAGCQRRALWPYAPARPRTHPRPQGR